MKKYIISMLLLTALVFMAGGCGSDDDDDIGGGTPDPTEPTDPPVPPYFQPGNDSRPTAWTTPDKSLYELLMSVQVQLGDSLALYQSSGDLMCATINGEVRAVTPPLITLDTVYYPLTIMGNGGEQTVDLHYYCDRLHRIYTITHWAVFNAAAAPTGESGIYRPGFVSH